jgi:hypothetical protein
MTASPHLCKHRLTNERRSPANSQPHQCMAVARIPLLLGGTPDGHHGRRSPIRRRRLAGLPNHPLGPRLGIHRPRALPPRHLLRPPRWPRRRPLRSPHRHPHLLLGAGARHLRAALACAAPLAEHLAHLLHPLRHRSRSLLQRPCRQRTRPLFPRSTSSTPSPGAPPSSRSPTPPAP